MKQWCALYGWLCSCGSRGVNDNCFTDFGGDGGWLLVRLKSDPFAAAFSFQAQRGSESKIAWNRGVGVQQKCCAPKSLNCWMPVTNLPTCYASSTENWGLSQMNGVRMSSVGAPERITWTNQSTDYTTCFLLHRTSGCTDSRSNHWSGIQVARACCQDARATAARTSLKVGIADSM